MRLEMGGEKTERTEGVEGEGGENRLPERQYKEGQPVPKSPAATGRRDCKPAVTEKNIGGQKLRSGRTKRVHNVTRNMKEGRQSSKKRGLWRCLRRTFGRRRGQAAPPEIRNPQKKKKKKRRVVLMGATTIDRYNKSIPSAGERRMRTQDKRRGSLKQSCQATAVASIGE